VKTLARLAKNLGAAVRAKQRLEHVSETWGYASITANTIMASTNPAAGPRVHPHAGGWGMIREIAALAGWENPEGTRGWGRGLRQSRLGINGFAVLNEL
jgi:hypothetical protein